MLFADETDADAGRLNALTDEGQSEARLFPETTGILIASLYRRGRGLRVRCRSR